MDGPPSGTSAPPPFLTKTYEMVDDSSTDSVVSWSEGGGSFVVWNQEDFSRELLPKYFKHNNFSSFVRQLNTYGFKKVDHDQWEFANDDFIRGQRHLLKNIHRRKPIHSHSLSSNQRQGSSSTTSFESGKLELEEEIEALKRSKNDLKLELRSHVQQQDKLDMRSQALVEKLHLAVTRQQQMLSFVGRVVGRPDVISDLAQLSENSKFLSIANKKRRLPDSDSSLGEVDAEEIQTMAFQVLGKENSPFRLGKQLSIEAFNAMGSSLNFMEDFFFRVGRASGEEIDILGDPCQFSVAFLSEFHAVSGCVDGVSPPKSPRSHLASPSLTDISTSPELAESRTHRARTNCTPPEETEHPQPLADGSKGSLIDMNLMPPTCKLRPLREPLSGLATSAGALAGANDVFWEQFLTEMPGSVDTQEVQSETRSDGRKLDGQPTVTASFWWNKKNVDHLTEQMGQLTPAERT